MRPMFTDFLCVKFTHLGGTFPYYSLHMWSYSPRPPPPLDPLKGHPNISAILSIYGMHRYENFDTKLWESVGNGHLYERVISAGTLEWRGTLRVPPQPGCPRVCPPWAHRSYATDRVTAMFGAFLTWLHACRTTVIFWTLKDDILQINT